MQSLDRCGSSYFQKIDPHPVAKSFFLGVATSQKARRAAAERKTERIAIAFCPSFFKNEKKEVQRSEANGRHFHQTPQKMLQSANGSAGRQKAPYEKRFCFYSERSDVVFCRKELHFQSVYAHRTIDHHRHYYSQTMSPCFARKTIEGAGKGPHALSCLSQVRVDPWRLAVWIAVAIMVVFDVVLIANAVPLQEPWSLGDIVFFLAFADLIILLGCLLVVAVAAIIVFVWRLQRTKARQRSFVLDGDVRTARAAFWRAFLPWSPTPPPSLLPEDWRGAVKRDHAEERYAIWFNRWSHQAGDLFSIAGGGTDDFGLFSVDGYANRHADTREVRLAWTQTYSRIVDSRAAFADTPGGSFIKAEHRATLEFAHGGTVMVGTWRMANDFVRPGDVSKGHFALLPLDADFSLPVNESAALL